MNNPSRSNRATDAGISVIFDMDGVLVDNVAVHLRAWREFAGRHGIPFDEHDFKAQHFGRTNPAILRGLVGDGLSDEDVLAMGDEKEALYRELHRGSIEPAPGLVPLLEALRSEGATMAVATAAPRENLDFVIEETGLRSFFQALVDVSLVERGKPDPQIYERAAALLGRPPERCVAVEDSHPGIESARAAGMKVLGISTTHRPEELAAADLVVPDFREVTPATFRRLLGDLN